MINIPINASRRYNVVMEKGTLKGAGFFLEEAFGSADKKLCIITDETVDALYGKKTHTLIPSLEVAGYKVFKYSFKGGELDKTMETVHAILEFLASKGFTRNDALVALGGGIVGDVAGFAAATYMRGIQYVQIPTTFLAIVDSSIGGKTGVNLSSGKNLAGAFWQPSLVLFDCNVLETLPYENKLDGIAEAIKAGVIAEPLILEAIASKQTLDDAEFLMNLASLAIDVKKKIVEEDELESQNRQLLNFGHTIAHAIEKCSSYKISHGHAVATGMAVVAKSSYTLGWTTQACRDEILETIERFHFSLLCPFSPWELADAASKDKKIHNDLITLVIPTALGKCTLKTIPLSKLEQFISYGLTQ
ncbi:MAG: 3-dehydroquinate synthase [Clostridiales bacterium]|nr:3-dehydroquinate synthase [Clostridiales bacterium]